MSETHTYRVESGTHYVTDTDEDGNLVREAYNPGETVDLTEEEAEGLGFKLTRVDGGDGGTATTDETSGSEAQFDFDGFLDRNVDPIAQDIESGEVDGFLDEIRAHEQEGEGRSTVLDAIDDRQAAQ